jgi:hypothetical protein
MQQVNNYDNAIVVMVKSGFIFKNQQGGLNKNSE